MSGIAGDEIDIQWETPDIEEATCALTLPGSTQSEKFTPKQIAMCVVKRRTYTELMRSVNNNIHASGKNVGYVPSLFQQAVLGNFRKYKEEKRKRKRERERNLMHEQIVIRTLSEKCLPLDCEDPTYGKN